MKGGPGYLCYGKDTLNKVMMNHMKDLGWDAFGRTLLTNEYFIVEARMMSLTESQFDLMLVNL